MPTVQKLGLTESSGMRMATNFVYDSDVPVLGDNVMSSVILGYSALFLYLLQSNEVGGGYIS